MKKNIKILHYHMDAAFMEDGGYLENVMSKCHSIKYSNTTILTTNKELLKNGTIEYVKAGTYVDRNGTKLIRLDVSKYKFIKKSGAIDGLLLFNKIYSELKKEKPDFIIVGSVGTLGNFPIAKYVRNDNPRCVVVCRSHATKENVDRKNHIIRRRVWDYIISLQNKYMIQYYKRVYGILPDAIDYMVNRFGIPQDKTSLLPLGYDDTLINFDRQDEIRYRVRERYGIGQNDYLIVHGGKLSPEKRTLEFIRSLHSFNEDIAAIVFGDFGAHIYGENVTTQYEDSVKEEAQRDSRHKIVFTGSLKQEEIYDLYLSADLAVFPGAPSCLRQEAVGAGLPIIMYVNPGDDGINININNNAYYLRDDWDEDTLSEAIETIYKDKSYYKRACELARGEYKKYSYTYLSEKIIEENL